MSGRDGGSGGELGCACLPCVLGSSLPRMQRQRGPSRVFKRTCACSTVACAILLRYRSCCATLQSCRRTPPGCGRQRTVRTARARWVHQGEGLSNMHDAGSPQVCACSRLVIGAVHNAWCGGRCGCNCASGGDQTDSPPCWRTYRTGLHPVNGYRHCATHSLAAPCTPAHSQLDPAHLHTH